MTNKIAACAFALTVMSYSLLGQSKGNIGISDSFRSASENVVDCLDGANLVSDKNDAVFYPQSLQCRSMLRRLERTATTGDERSLASAIREYQIEISACHVTLSQQCEGAKPVRDKAIHDGRLREPDAPGK